MHQGRQIPENSGTLYQGYAAQKFLDGDLEVHINGRHQPSSVGHVHPWWQANACVTDPSASRRERGWGRRFTLTVTVDNRKDVPNDRVIDLFEEPDHFHAS